MAGGDAELTVGGIDLPLPVVIVEDDVVVAASERAPRLAPEGGALGPLADWFEAADAEVVGLALGEDSSQPRFVQLRSRDRWVELHVSRDEAEGRRLVLLREATDEQFVRVAVDAVADSTFV